MIPKLATLAVSAALAASMAAPVTALGAAVALLMLPTIVDSLFNGAGI